jgi:gluconate 2-dehydrogenase gamma chain
VAATIRAAVERIIPSDDGLPGAREAGTADFVLEEAAVRGAAGIGALAERAAMLDAAAAAAGPSRTFADLDPAGQDEILAALERSSSAAFRWLVETTMEGFYADPRHGGNRNAVSWQLIGFPGPTGGRGYEPPYGWYDANEPNLPGLGPNGSTEPTRRLS